MSVDFSIEWNGNDEDAVWDNAPGINVSNSNAAALLEVLGLPTNPWDTPEGFEYPTGQDFLGRVLLALGLVPADAGVPAHAPNPERPNFIDCGRREGYLQERLGQLRELADYAIAHNRRIDWS